MPRNINDRFPKSTGAISRTEAPAESAITEDVIVKIRLDKEEGLSPEKGRYNTMYNLNFVHKRWLGKTGNAELLAGLYQCFVILDVKPIVWAQPVFGEEFVAWAEEHAKDYYLLAPIAKVSKHAYRFSGMHLPTRHTNREDTDTGKAFALQQSDLKAIGLCIFGKWSSKVEYANMVMDSYPDQAQEKKLWLSIEKAIVDWLESAIPELSMSIGGELGSKLIELEAAANV